MNKQYIKIHDGLYLDLSKAGEKSGHKYYKRVPKPTGKGYNYFYTRQQFKDYKEKGIVPGEKKGGILSGIMAFFGFKDEAKAQAKVKQVYEANKKDLSGVTVKTFTDHMNEYLGNKAKWDAKFSAKPGEKKEAGPKTDKPKSEKDKSGVMSTSGQKWDISLMKKIAGYVGSEKKETAMERADREVSAEREKQGLSPFTVVDNMTGKSTIIYAKNKMDAISNGASHFKSTNIRVTEKGSSQKSMKGKPVAEGEFKAYLENEKKLDDANARLNTLDPDSSEYKKAEKISEAMEKELDEQVKAAAKSYGITEEEFVNQLNAYSEKKGKSADNFETMPEGKDKNWNNVTGRDLIHAAQKRKDSGGGKTGSLEWTLDKEKGIIEASHFVTGSPWGTIDLNSGDIIPFKSGQEGDLKKIYNEILDFSESDSDKQKVENLMNYPIKNKNEINEIALKNKGKEWADKIIEKNQSDKSPVMSGELKSQDDIDKYIEEKSKEYGGKNKFLASDEYKKIYPEIKKIHEKGKQEKTKESKKYEIVKDGNKYKVKTGMQGVNTKYLATGAGQSGMLTAGSIAEFDTEKEAKDYAEKYGYSQSDKSAVMSGKDKYKKIASHKNWVSGATITESRKENGDTRFVATIDGWRNFDIYEGKPGDEISKKVQAKVREIRDKLKSGDESVLNENSRIDQSDKSAGMSGENISMDTEKMRSVKMPKEIKSKGIDSKEYKEWIKENWSKTSEKQSDKREITSQGDKISAAADKLDAAVKGGKSPEDMNSFVRDKIKNFDERIKRAEKEIADAQKKKDENKEPMLQMNRINEARNFIEDMQDQKKWYSGGRGDSRVKEEYRKAIADKKELSFEDKKMFPDMVADRLKSETGLNFYHDEDASGTGIRFSNDGKSYRINEIKKDGTYEIGDNSGRIVTVAEPKDIKRALTSVSEESAKSDKERNDNIKSQGWQPSNASKEGFKLRMGSGFRDISPKDIKKTFKVWGEDIFIIKSPNGGYSATEKKTGLKIGDGTNIEKAIDKAKTMLAMQGEKRFKEAVSSQENKESSSGKSSEELDSLRKKRDKLEKRFEKMKWDTGIGSDNSEYTKTKNEIKDLKEKISKLSPMQKASELQRGTEEESEHKATVKFIAEYLKKHNKLPSNEEIYKSIAKDHIGDIPDYYSRLSKMEKEAKLTKATDALFEELGKAKEMPVGTVSKGYKKVGKGKWVKVGKGGGEKKPDEKKPKKKPGKDEKKPAEKGGLDEEKRGIMKSALKKVANILAEALSGRDVNAPTGAAVEQTGENIKGMAKKTAKTEEKKPKKKQEGDKK